MYVSGLGWHHAPLLASVHAVAQSSLYIHKPVKAAAALLLLFIQLLDFLLPERFYCCCFHDLCHVNSSQAALTHKPCRVKQYAVHIEPGCISCVKVMAPCACVHHTACCSPSAAQRCSSPCILHIPTTKALLMTCAVTEPGDGCIMQAVHNPPFLSECHAYTPKVYPQWT